MKTDMQSWNRVVWTGKTKLCREKFSLFSRPSWRKTFIVSTGWMFEPLQAIILIFFDFPIFYKIFPLNRCRGGGPGYPAPGGASPRLKFCLLKFFPQLQFSKEIPLKISSIWFFPRETSCKKFKTHPQFYVKISNNKKYSSFLKGAFFNGYRNRVLSRPQFLLEIFT